MNLDILRMPRPRRLSRSSCVALIAAALLVPVGCAALDDNDGSTLTTTDGQQIQKTTLIGKWDLDGERTNTANGRPGIGAIPDDIAKDIFGKGWRFRSGGVLLTDKTIGAQEGTWRLEGKDQLHLRERPSASERIYTVSFRDGYMYLRRPDGEHLVMERNKFFGF